MRGARAQQQQQQQQQQQPRGAQVDESSARRSSRDALRQASSSRSILNTSSDQLYRYMQTTFAADGIPLLEAERYRALVEKRLERAVYEATRVGLERRLLEDTGT